MLRDEDVVESKPVNRFFPRFNKPLEVMYCVAICLGTMLCINEIFQLGFVYHEFFYYYGLLAVFLSFSFLLYPAYKGAPKDKVPWYDFGLFLLTIVCCSYIMVNAYRISSEGWVYVGPLSSTIVSILLWGIALEALRRVGGLALFFFAAFFSFYPIFALHMPGFLQGAQWSLPKAAMFHAMTRESIIGIPTRVFCNLVYGFIVFGVVLQETGGAKFFIDFSYAIFGGVRGGAAKVSVVASALFGSMSGSAISNVATVGPMTIPTMKKSGYPSYYAGAVEACASSGGVIMPPVMGAVAFIMASFLQVPYSDVVIAAIIPSALYFFGLFVQIDGFAARKGLVGLPKSELPSIKATLMGGWIYAFALFALVYLLFYLRQEGQAPFIASAFLLIGATFKKETRPNLKTLYVIIIKSGKLLTEMLAVMAGIGLIIGGLSMTGVAVSFSSNLVHAVGNDSMLLLLAGALTSFVLGMGMTISACYIFLAIVLVPALVPFHLNEMACNFFVMYCGLWSFITPPVALGSYVAAGIAGADFWKTSLESMRLGFVKYFIPFFLVYQPALIFQGKEGILVIIQSITTAFVGVFFVGSGIEGYLLGIGKLTSVTTRVLCLISGFALFVPGTKSDMVGLLSIGLTYGYGLLYGTRRRESRKHLV